jgi:carbamoyltransferase
MRETETDTHSDGRCLKNAMRILGLSSFRHDSSAALLVDGKLVAAIEDAKLSRGSSRGLPETAIKYCLTTAGLNWHNLDAIAIASRPLQGWVLRSWRAARTSPFSPIAGAYYEANQLGGLASDLGNLRILRHKNGRTSSSLATFDHHLCHAASAFYLSPFERALILTMDEEGDGQTGTLALGEGQNIRVLEKIPFPNSLAWVYSQITELLGFVPHKEEHKTQWLSLGAEPVFKQVFLGMMRNSRNLLPHLDSSFLQHGVTGRFALSSKLYRQLGIAEGATAEMSEDQQRALASSVQQACTEIVQDLLKHYCRQYGIDNVCLAGGLFQNVLLISDVERQLGLDKVFVPPAPGNSGCAVGAAAMAWHQSKGQGRIEAEGGSYWGPAYDREEIKGVLDNYKTRYSILNTSDRKYDATVQLLSMGKVVGWFQGRTEFGPRALGNRSLLASPWAPYVSENLNDYVKHREWFRPFAVSVPQEDCGRYFEFSNNCCSMNSLARVRSDAAAIPRNFCLPGDRIRLHVVERKSNPVFWSLLKRFGQQAPAPILLNTSFNIAGEPLVARPQDAVRSYFCSGIDALMIDSFALSKAALPQVTLKERVAV